MQRSSDPLVALHYHLSEAKRRDALCAIVVADGQGIVVGGAGSWPICEELAAYAPLLWLTAANELTGRAQELAQDCWVQPFIAGGDEILLCARGARASSENVRHAIEGVTRILAA
jgi:hypothetical protein